MRYLSSPKFTGALQMTGADVVIEPGKGHDFHKHPDQEELIYVLSGTLEQWVGEERRMLGAGDAVFLARGQVHASFNVGSDDVRMIVIFGPAVGENGFEAVEVAGEMPWAGLRVAEAV
jgi:quercetin dioxygenase-like cupin family protein